MLLAKGRSDADPEDIQPEDVFTLAEDGEDQPAAIAAFLVEQCEELMELRIGGPVVVFLMRHDPKIKGGRLVLGEMCLPRFSGALGAVGTWLLAKACGGIPDYVMLIDAAFWRSATIHQRYALVHHEMMHAGPALDREGEPRFDADGNPEWGIRGHDLEEFNATVQRFGAWDDSIVRFRQALERSGNAPGMA